MPISHRVVEVFSDQSVSDITYEIDPAVVNQMVTAGLLALTDKQSELEVWTMVMPQRNAGEKISLKVNALNADVPTSPELSAAISSSMIQGFQVPPEEIFVWDRTTQDLNQAGLNEEREGVACVGTEISSKDPTGLGYESQHVCLSGKKIYLSDLLTQETKHLINVAVMKNHSVAGFTGCLKNHYGSFSNPWDYHQDTGKHIARLSAIPQVSQTTRLYVIDALLGVCLGDEDPTDPRKTCGLHLYQQFIQDPKAPLDTSCRTQVEPFDFVGNPMMAQIFFGTNHIYENNDTTYADDSVNVRQQELNQAEIDKIRLQWQVL